MVPPATDIIVFESSGKLPRLVEALRRNAISAEAPLALQRRRFEALAGGLPVNEEVCCRPVDAGGVPAEWLEPVSGPADRSVLYFHGGGFVLGSLTTIRPMAANLAVATGRRVLTVGYRLAPEHPCPAAIEDAVRAWVWLVEQGVDTATVAFGGDSAGAGLAVAALVALRDRELPLPGACLCLSPWVDLTLSATSIDRNAAGDPEVSRPKLAAMAEHYLAGADPRSRLASPVFADLSRLPPLLIQTGTAEALVDDARRLADAARGAGVPVTLELYQDMIHVWHAFAPGLPEATDAFDRIATWLALH